MIGRTLSHFRVTSKIGEGGMGVVYRAEDETLRRPVALKVLPPELVKDEERRLRFLREARAAAAVTHPNIATIYEVGEEPDESGQGPGVVFIAMELVEGRPLSAVIGGRPMPVKDALRVAVEIAEGLARAHKGKVIHRDLKPDNVVIGEDGRAKILDFGLAKLLEPVRGGAVLEGADRDLSKLETLSGEMTREGRVLGTAAYMSPEQARGQPVDARSDIFSLGVTLYEMATGQVPFRGRTGMDTLAAILEKEPVPPRALNPAAPPDLERIILKCLQKDPQDRYQHAEDAVVDLRAARRTTESGVQAVPPRRALSRRTAAVAAGAALIAAGVAAALFLTGRLPFGGARSASPGEPASATIDSLAVLPLRNLSGDPNEEYFADGMTEELTATLARIRSLRVISSTSAMYYKGKQKPLREIASELDVDAIVEGSVMRSGGRVRVTAQLVEGGTDRHLWAQSYERDMRDVLALQGEVARAIAGEVKAVLAPAEAARLADARTVNPEAYEHYLAGRHLFARLTKEGLTRALEEFERAIEKDPDYAPAHAGLAMTYLSLADWSVASPREAFRKARAAALRAVEIDPTLAQAQLARAMTKLKVERDWAGAEAALLRAIELSPNDADARSEHAWHLLRLGRMDEALAEAMQAHQLAPLSPYHTLALVTVDGNARRYDEALIQTNRLLDLHPDYGPGKDLLAMLYVEMGRYEEGIQALRDRLEAPDAEVPAVMMYLVRAYALAGKPAQARALLSDLLDLAKRIYVPPNYVAGALGSVGDKERAFEWLGRALEENDPVVLFLKVGPWFDPLRSDPRFADLLRRAGLAEN